MSPANTVPTTHEKVRAGYGAIAESGGSCCGPGSSCSGSSATERAKGFGYSEADLAALPEGANLGLSCGNPTALASLQEGDVVVDLGSGAGLDAFIASRRVGPTGRVIGVDMTPAMIDRARANLSAHRESTGLDNVEFRLGEIEHLPLADASVDVVLSNCVINLSPDKAQVWREIARVLRPGGRVSVSDIALLRPLPEALRESAEALIGCVAGAQLIPETEQMIRDAGLTDVTLTQRSDNLGSAGETASSCMCDGGGETPSESLPIVSLTITARKV